ncbi:hypothetical protein A2U01_0094826, partial [Trifolium medium]|nr:hypothetical protein [Trifolium medium]
QPTTCTLNTFVQFSYSSSSACTHGYGPVVVAFHNYGVEHHVTGGPVNLL